MGDAANIRRVIKRQLHNKRQAVAAEQSMIERDTDDCERYDICRYQSDGDRQRPFAEERRHEKSKDREPRAARYQRRKQRKISR